MLNEVILGDFPSERRQFLKLSSNILPVCRPGGQHPVLEWLRSFLGSTLDSEAWLGECLNNYGLESYTILESGMFWLRLDPLVSFRS